MSSPDWPQDTGAATPVAAVLRAMSDHLNASPHLDTTITQVDYTVSDGAPIVVVVEPPGVGTHVGMLLAWRATMTDPVVTVGYIYPVGNGEVHLHLTGTLTRGELITVVAILAPAEARLLAGHMAVAVGAVVPAEVLHQVLPVDGQAGQAVDQ